MSLTWNWWLFFGALIPGFILVALARGTDNASNAASDGPRYQNAYQTERGASTVGTLFAGAAVAALATAIAGFIFEVSN